MHPIFSRRLRAFGLALSLFAVPATAATESGDPAASESTLDNGTDPTRVNRIAEAKYEYLELDNGVGSGTLRLTWTQPVGPKGGWALIARVPVAVVDTGSGDSYAVGDASLKLSRVFGKSRQGGWVAQGELILDTAARPELGSGRNVLKGTLVHARFLRGGAIFAPAWVQSRSVGGDSRRAVVDATTLDFYYVPKLPDPRNLITFDPALNFDWRGDKAFCSLSVTAGRVLGPALGGKAIAFVKPTMFAGGDRPGSWGIEIGYKVLGF
jgi:hypothetical protein